MDSDFQLKLLIAIITLCFTGIFGIIGFLFKKLIDDIGTKIDKIMKRQDEFDSEQKKQAVQLARHELQIKYLEEKIGKKQ